MPCVGDDASPSSINLLQCPVLQTGMACVLHLICSLCVGNVKVDQRRVFLLNLVVEFADCVLSHLVGSLSSVDKGGDLANGSLDPTRKKSDRKEDLLQRVDPLSCYGRPHCLVLLIHLLGALCHLLALRLAEGSGLARACSRLWSEGVHLNALVLCKIALVLYIAVAANA